MADFIFIRKTRNFASSAIHMMLNILFGIAAVFITMLTNSPAFGILLVFTSKWRVFAVRPRYLWLNIKSSLVDFIVCTSIVLIAYFYGVGSLALNIILSILFCIWLLLIKPKTSEKATQVQSLIAVFLGTIAAVALTTNTDPIFLVLVEFIIGYSACRHVISQSDDKDYALTTLTSGLIFAEISWICNTWMIFYVYDIIGLKIPGLAIYLSLFTYVFNKARISTIKNDGKLIFKDILAPTIFSIVVIAVIVIWFNDPIFNIK